MYIWKCCLIIFYSPIKAIMNMLMTILTKTVEDEIHPDTAVHLFNWKKKNERKKWTCNLMAHPVNLRSFFFSLKMVFKKWCNAWCHWFEFEEKAWQVVRLLLSHFCCCCCRCCLDLEFEPFTWLERFVDFALFTKKSVVVWFLHFWHTHKYTK